MYQARFCVAINVAFALLITSVGASDLGPQGVSPGALDRIARIDGGCPAFSWEATPGAERYELVVYRLDADAPTLASIELTSDNEVLYTSISGRATAWSPEAADCFAPGDRYVWFVRAVTDAETGEGSDWSQARFFEVDAAPSVDELERAIEVLRRWEAANGDVSPMPSTAATPAAASTSLPDSGAGSGTKFESTHLKSVINGTAAIRGLQTDFTGETYGVVGVSASPDGAGIGAANVTGGPDLVLDGAVPAEISEAGIDRSSASAQTFSFANTGGGGMMLDIDGVEVVTTATDQDVVGALSCASGEVAKYNGSAWNCAPDDDTTYSAGTGMSLSATTFSVDSSVIQARVSGTCTAGSSIRVIASNGTVTCEPDTDTNTTYSAGTGMTLSGTTFSTQHYAFSAYSGGGPTLAQGDVITFGTEHYDDGAVFNTTNNRFTAPVAGVYHFDVHIRFWGAPTANEYMWYALYVSGNLIKDTTGATSTDTWGLMLSADLKLTAGQYVDVRMGTTGSTPGYASGNMNTWFNGHKVP